MGYRSDIRIITSKKGFEELTKYVKKYLGDIEWEHENLLDHLDVTQSGENEIYFGWDYVKWYENCGGYEDVTAIMKGLDYISESGYGYRYARLGEEYDDYEEKYDDGNNEDWLDWIRVTRKFDDGGDE